MYRYPEPATDKILRRISTDLWTLEAPDFIYFRPPIQPKMPYPHRSVIIRLADRSLMIISPIKLTAEIREIVDELGRVAHILSPNAIHHLHMGKWKEAYPEARMYASPHLPRRRKDLQFDAVLTTVPEDAWADQVDQCIFGESGFLPEVVFHHRASRALVFTDLIMDFDPQILTPLSRITSRLNQMYKHTPYGVQLANNAGREESRRVLETIRQWSAEHLVISHSPWLCVDGADDVEAVLDDAFDWLMERSAFAEAVNRGIRTSVGLAIWPLHSLVSYLFDDLIPRATKSRT